MPCKGKRVCVSVRNLGLEVGSLVGRAAGGVGPEPLLGRVAIRQPCQTVLQRFASMRLGPVHIASSMS